MNNLKRNKRTIYLCNQTIENGRIIYSAPTKFKLNYQPISNEGEIITTGLDYINRLIVYARPNIAKNFKNGDRCYVFVEPPTPADITCNTADFYVDGTQNRYINESTFHLQRMLGDDNG